MDTVLGSREVVGIITRQSLWCLVLLGFAANADINSLTADGCISDEHAQLQNVATTPSEDFSDNGDGTVTHHTTGLIWQRCDLGQTWDGNSCIGDAAGYSWQQALQQAAQDSFAGFNDWRLPTQQQLASIIEYRCVAPTINAQIFPETGSVWYWSSTAHPKISLLASAVDFYDGDVGYQQIRDSYAVRLVRGAE